MIRIKKYWFTDLITPQAIVFILAGFASLVIFWNTQKEHTGKIDILEKNQENKVDLSDFNALVEKVNKQYDNNKGRDDRINAIEKQLEYQRGIHDALKGSPVK